MLKFKKKSLIFFLTLCLLLLSVCSSIPTLRPFFVNTLRQPLNLVTLVRRELTGIIFYHRNFIQNERLNREISLLKNKLSAQEEAFLENTRLKKLLSLKQKSAYKLIAARVIARSPDSWTSAVIIDKGRHDGIRRGMVAVNFLGLVGRVIETQESTSKILLINDPNIGISAMVQRSRQEGLVSGTLGTSLVMRYLSKESDINIADVIITSGLNATYPKGLLIGSVVDIVSEFSGLTRYAIIKPAVDLSNIEEVLVVVQ